MKKNITTTLIISAFVFFPACSDDEDNLPDPGCMVCSGLEDLDTGKSTTETICVGDVDEDGVEITLEMLQLIEVLATVAGADCTLND